MDSSVPAGCPLHFVTPAASAPASFEVQRDRQPITLPSMISIVDTVGVPMPVVDPNDCECRPTDATVWFTRQALMLTGAEDGDQIAVDSSGVEGLHGATITEAGPCPEVSWPARLVIATQCDRCPRPPSSPPSSPSPPSSCATGEVGTGGLAIVILLGAVARRRPCRRRR